MKYLKNFEDADSVKINNINTHYLHKDAYPIAWDGTQVVIGDNSSTHSDSGIFDFEFAGRIWIDRKIISFWYYPDKDIFNKIIDGIEKQMLISIWNNGYLIEIIFGENDEIIKDEEETYQYIGRIYRKLIPIEEYEKSINSSEKERAIHLMDPKEKEEYYKKYGKPKGFGSDLKSKKNPIWWEQAKRTSENMIMRFKKYSKM